MAVTRGVYLEDHEDEVIQELATEKKWSLSQMIAELMRESPTFIERIRTKRNSPSKPTDTKTRRRQPN